MRALGIGCIAVATLLLAGCNDTSAQESDGAFTRLQDRIAIEDLIVDYYAHLGGSPDGLGDYYTEDAVFDVNGVVLTGREEIEGIYRGPAPAEGASPEPATPPERDRGVSHMLLGTPIIDVQGDQATAKFIWTQIGNPDVHGAPVLIEQGREYDLLVKRDGRWLITKRTVIADSGMPARFDTTYQPRLDYDITAD